MLANKAKKQLLQ